MNQFVVIKISPLIILLIGALLILEVFYIDRSISYQFEPSMITLDSLLPSKVGDEKSGNY